MGWTAVVQKNPGDLITDTIYNNQIILNLDYLKDEVDAIDAPDSDDYAEVTNTTDETTVFSKTISADSLGTDGFLIAELWIRLGNTTAGAVNITVRWKFGSTTIQDHTFSVSNHATSKTVYKNTMLLQNDDSASSQIIMVDMHYLTSYMAANTETSANVTNYSMWNTASEDTTGALTLSATVEWASADAGLVADCSGMWMIGPFDPA